MGTNLEKLVLAMLFWMENYNRNDFRKSGFSFGEYEQG